MSSTVGQQRSTYRLDIQGIRGVAVLLVVLYHVFFGRVSGGVDVFLFISAFFLTGSFMRRIERGEATRPLAYWAKTFKRLLPPAVLVILGTLAAVKVVFPEGMWFEAMRHGLASLGQVMNWVLVIDAVDYYATDHSQASPFQHFWSLSIQGQVFLLFPVLFALIAVIARATRRGAQSARVIGLALFVPLTVASFIYSVYLTGANQEVAYFSTLTRLWEFTLGGILAIVFPALTTIVASMPATLYKLLMVGCGWAGFIGLVSCGALLDVNGQFPGWIAIWPLASAALMMIAGIPHATHAYPATSVSRLMASKPVTFLGDMSYALYLVHWPLLITYLVHQSLPSAEPWAGVAIVAISLILAWVLTVVVDSPIRRWTWANARTWRATLVAAGSAGLAAGLILVAQAKLTSIIEEQERRAYMNNPGARVLATDFTPHPEADPQAPELPGMIGHRADQFELPEECTGIYASDDEYHQSLCRMNIPETGEEEKVLLMLGNSRLEQLAPAVTTTATEHEWRVVTFFRPECYFGQIGGDGGKCDPNYEHGIDYINRVKPDAILLATTWVPYSGEEIVNDRLTEILDHADELDIDVIALRDTPRWTSDIVSCRAESDDRDCVFDPGTNMAGTRPDESILAEHPARTYGLDLTELICPDGQCVPVIGNVTVMVDSYHMSQRYSESMAPQVAELLGETGWTWD